ncbi:hypothetical protein GCM10012286_76060 [Streptomyces lasiicapitis]|uniref:Uncharacterized protein n=1 Tax=Streptomyces lasiicapitis TaxID=1923961 RepID=A0ABQ2MTZ1_9ACTN|nr:hypothetical protein GCM10012286_76060 [Streptomyces lasiicapitis]
MRPATCIPIQTATFARSRGARTTVKGSLQNELPGPNVSGGLQKCRRGWFRPCARLGSKCPSNIHLRPGKSPARPGELATPNEFGVSRCPYGVCAVKIVYAT